MGALVQTSASCFASLKLIETQSGRIEARSTLRVGRIGVAPAHEPHAFPEASAPPTLPATIRDEMVEFYAFVFSQGGFRQLGMTFEQFRRHQAGRFLAKCEEAWTFWNGRRFVTYSAHGQNQAR
jgi:hypothetical protein